MNHLSVKFSNETNSEFFQTLRARVNTYFETRGIKKQATGGMMFKTVFMIALYFIPYLLMMTGVVESAWLIMTMFILMSFGMAGIGMGVMHDANHGSYSRYHWLNTILGNMLSLLGGSTLTWKIQHNMLHHSYTNIDGLDDDIDIGGMIRCSPGQKRRWFHRLQFGYAWFLYMFVTLNWFFWKDYPQLLKYREMGLVKNKEQGVFQLFGKLIISKVIYAVLFLILPIAVLPVSWWVTLIFFLVMHFIAGFILGSIFQAAHVVPESEFGNPDGNGRVEDSWAVHQLKNTSNFATGNPVVTWLIGGLNFQTEHHLFPNICHVHYKNLSVIVKQTTREFGIPYHTEPSFFRAMWKHGVMLYLLGKKDALTA
ncbi:MAG: acyl-CoA desaturase [Bacteroidetes bacterium]|nr:acyl-CoA desaturase [Bacteroidota bacterium]